LCKIPSIKLTNNFTITFYARWDSLNDNSTIFDFSNGKIADNITAYNYEKSNSLIFSIYNEGWRSFIVEKAIEPGSWAHWCLIVSDSFDIKIIKDGILL